jgi:hypothetical protein
MRRERKKTFHSLNNYDVRTSTQNRSIFMFSKRVKKFWSILKKCFFPRDQKFYFELSFWTLLGFCFCWVAWVATLILILFDGTHVERLDQAAVLGIVGAVGFQRRKCQNFWLLWNWEKILFEVVVMKTGKNLTFKEKSHFFRSSR